MDDTLQSGGRKAEGPSGKLIPRQVEQRCRGAEYAACSGDLEQSLAAEAWKAKRRVAGEKSGEADCGQMTNGAGHHAEEPGISRLSTREGIRAAGWLESGLQTSVQAARGTSGAKGGTRDSRLSPCRLRTCAGSLGSVSRRGTRTRQVAKNSLGTPGVWRGQSRGCVTGQGQPGTDGAAAMERDTGLDEKLGRSNQGNVLTGEASRMTSLVLTGEAGETGERARS